MIMPRIKHSPERQCPVRKMSFRRNSEFRSRSMRSISFPVNRGVDSGFSEFPAFQRPFEDSRQRTDVGNRRSGFRGNEVVVVVVVVVEVLEVEVVMARR